MRGWKVLGLAGLVAVATGASAWAGWKAILFPQGTTLAKQDDGGAFLNAFIETFGAGDRQFGSVLSLNAGMPQSFTATRARFASLGSFDLEGVEVHQYYSILNAGSTAVEAIALQDRGADWLMALVRAWSACGAKGYGAGASLMVRAFAARIAAEESSSVARQAVDKFMRGIEAQGLQNVGYESEAQIAKVDGFRTAVAGMDTDTFFAVTDGSEAEELAKRGLKLIQDQGISGALGQ